jgi:hypothetical protein
MTDKCPHCGCEDTYGERTNGWECVYVEYRCANCGLVLNGEPDSEEE